MTDRTQQLKQMILDAPYWINMERVKYWTDSYKETEGQHPAIRQARALEKILDNMKIFILDQEQIVGHRTDHLLGALPSIERGDFNLIIKSELKKLKKRQNKPFQITEEDEKYLKKIALPYWKGKTVCEKKLEIFEKNDLLSDSVGLFGILKAMRHFGWEWTKEIMGVFFKRITNIKSLNKFLTSTSPNSVNTILDDQGHLVMGHNNLLKMGYSGIKRLAMDKLEEVNEYLASHPEKSHSCLTNGGSFVSTSEDVVMDYLEDNFQERFVKNNSYSFDNKAFLEAVLVCCDATERFIKRFAKLSKKKSQTEENESRSAELEQISEICNWIANNKPRSFREALQLAWFNEVIGNISHGLGGILAIGRPDQYLYPYYKADLEAGSISNEKVTELLEEFIIKSSSNLLMLPVLYEEDNDASELGGDHLAITVGGVDKDGKDAVNELSYLFMDAIENMKCMTVSYSVRIAPENPREWIQRAIDVHQVTNGAALYNDSVIIPALQNVGVTLEDARDYAIVGCVEPAPQGNAFPITAGNAVSLSGLLEMLLNNGKPRLGGKFPGIEVPDPEEYKSYEEFWNAYKQLMKEVIAHTVKCANIKDMVHAENYPNPFVSMTLEGCIENALDMTQGGAKYNFNTFSSSGIGTVANSLAALKKVVFEDQVISIKEMITILNKNFKNKEIFRQKLINKVPKFGNDDDYVDSIAKDLCSAYSDELLNHSTIRAPGKFRPCFFSAGTHVLTGHLLGATPDGRKGGKAVSNSCSPSNNTEKNGPTAVLNSLAKLETTKITCGLALNMRLLPALLKTADNRSKIADLVLSYFKSGGLHVQFNVINQEDLLDAQIHPENYRDLVVRVSGYCDYFTNLSKALQDDIIERYQFDRI